MDAILPIIVQIVAGVIGGNALGTVLKNINLGPLGNSIAGAVGGVGGTWLAGMIPGLATLVAAGAPAATGAGGLDMSMLLGQGVTGLVGGGILQAIAGTIKNMSAKS